MKFSELVREAGYGSLWENGLSDPEITGIAFDTRECGEGSLFVALRGGRCDSHGLLKEAARRGAVCAAVEEYVSDAPIPLLRFHSTRDALARLTDAFYGHPTREMSLVGVTGTNGKTSVAHALYHILTESGRATGLIGTVTVRSRGRALDGGDPEHHMTTPDPPQLYRYLREMRDDGCTVAVTEATSHASALGKLSAVTFELLIFTNLTRDHLDFHLDFERYFLAKAELFRRTRRALINLDGSTVSGDPEGYAERIVRVARESGAEVFTCSADPNKNADFLLCDFTEDLKSGSSFTLKIQDGKRDLRILSHLLGRYSGMNLLESAAAALMLGVTPECIASALGSYEGVAGRLERISSENDDITVIIDFAHTPDALESVLRTVRELRRSEGRITVLFGCGGDRDPSKRREMGIIASRLADLVYITSDNSRSENPAAIAGEILRGIDKEKPYRVILSRKEAIEKAVLDAGAGDILLLCGKGHERYTVDRDGVHPFDEAGIAREALRQRSTKRQTEVGHHEN